MASNPNDGTSVPLIERVKNILISPRTEWPRIEAEPSTIGGIYRSYVMILAAIPPIASLIGGLVFGYPGYLLAVRPPLGVLIGSSVLSYLMSLAGVYVLALIIEALAPTFSGTKDRVRAFKVAAYSYTAAWVAGILTLLPALAIVAMLLSLYCFYLLYLGLPVLMKSPAEKSLAYVVACVVASIVIYIVFGMITGAVMASLMPAPTSAPYIPA